MDIAQDRARFRRFLRGRRPPAGAPQDSPVDERTAPLPGGRAETDLRAAYRLCRRITRSQDPGAYAVLRLLPPVLHPACWAVWAGLTVVDDLIDDRDATPAERATRADAWMAALETDMAAGTSTDPIRRALVDTAERWHVDLSDFRNAVSVSRNDIDHQRFDDWAQWRAWSRGHIVPMFDTVRLLLGQAGVPVVFRLDRLESYQQLNDGIRLVDTLTDLHTDQGEDKLLLPEEILNEFPGAEDDLLHGRWSPAAADLVTELTSIARRWVNQPHLTHGMHPGTAVAGNALISLLLALLDAVEAAGPALLRSQPRPSHLTRARIFLPARLRTALVWSLTPLTPPDTRQRRAATGPCPATRPIPGTTAFQQPPRHPSGCRPPRIEAEAMPAHVAIVMDGNGRWSEQRALPRSEGHRAGAAALREMVYGALEIGLRHLTVYAFSTENWRRDTEEVERIMSTLREELDDDPFRDLDVRLRWSGNPEKLPTDLVESLRQKEAATRTRTGLTCTLCFNYGGRDEITRAAASLARAARAGDLDPDLVGEDDFARHLALTDLPDVDLLWRTGGERRTSNFLPWQSTYAELHFTSGYWPDADRRDLWQAITEYGNRQRRYGT